MVVDLEWNLGRGTRGEEFMGDGDWGSGKSTQC